MDSNDIQNYKDHYSEDSMWNKLYRFAKKAGKETVSKVLTLYYALSNAAGANQAIIIGALGYFIMPFDLISDLFPGGLVDDIAVMAMAINAVSDIITPSVKEKAEEETKKLLGDDGES